MTRSGNAYPISIHAPLAGRDQERADGLEHRLEFQSTRPSRGATLLSHSRRPVKGISIHAPLAGRD